MIVVGVDASTRSEDAIALARRLAQPGRRTVVAAAVVPPAHADRDAAHATVRRMSGLAMGAEPERVRTAVVTGRTPAEGLHRLAETDRALAIVVGSSHRGRLGRVTPGSTAARLLSGAPCAVALAPDGYRTRAEEPITRVGVAFDGSQESRNAFAVALAAAHAYDAELEVITVIPTEVYGAPGYELLRADVESVLRRQHEDALVDLPETTRVRSTVVDGDPAQRLAERSGELDLLVIGSRGYGPLRAVLLGGTSGAVLRTAQCPVLVLPRGVLTPLFDDGKPAVRRARTPDAANA